MPPKNQQRAHHKAQHSKTKHKMPKSVKIKRVHREHKHISAKEKILGGLGVGSTLLGGIGAIAAKPAQTQFVRSSETETGQKTSKVKQTLGNLFGINSAKAEGLPSGSNVADDDVEVFEEEEEDQDSGTTASDTDEVEVLNESGSNTLNTTNSSGEEEVEVLNETENNTFNTTNSLGEEETEVLNENEGNDMNFAGNNGDEETEVFNEEEGGSLNNLGAGSGQNVDALNSQITALQGQVNSLTAQLQNSSNSGSSVADIQTINALRAQIFNLQQALAQAQSQQSSVKTYNLQMPTGYSASASSKAQSSNSASNYQTAEAGGTYTVKKGDTLWGISRRYYGDGRLWRNILNENPNSLSRPGNVRTLRIGYVLNIPKLDANGSVIKTYDLSAQATQESNTPSNIQTQNYTPQGASQYSSNTGTPNLNVLGSQSTQNSMGSSAANSNSGFGGSSSQGSGASTGQAGQNTGDIIYKASGSDVGDDDKIIVGDDEEVEVFKE